jgi:hypothetical protein
VVERSSSLRMLRGVQAESGREKLESKNVTGFRRRAPREWVDQNDSVSGKKSPIVREESSGWECESESEVQAESVSGESRLRV